MLQVAVHAANGELEASLLGARNGLAALGLSTACRTLASLAGHACLVIGLAHCPCLFYEGISTFAAFSERQLGEAWRPRLRQARFGSANGARSSASFSNSRILLQKRLLVSW
jgi:hypothetical protein